jgi:triacylglycerol lipase
MNAMPQDIARGLAAIGRVIDPPATTALYAPLHGPTPGPGVRVERDVQYGPADRNRLDIFAVDPAGATAKPVLMFVHGGGFVGGDKQVPDTPFHDNIGTWAARHGIVGVTMTYRLAPQAPWPAGPEDVAAAVRRVRENISAHGGDPARLYLMGHSAGATHVATYVGQPKFHGPDGPGLAGLILSSGIYDLTTFALTDPRYRAYFGEDESLYAARSALPGLVQGAVPLMVIHAELDPPPFVQQAETIRDALTRAGKAPRFLRLAGHNHLSGTCSIGTADASLSGPILDFVGNAG